LHIANNENIIALSDGKNKCYTEQCIFRPHAKEKDLLSKVLNSREDYRMGICGGQTNLSTVRLNHAAADGYLLAKVFQMLQQEIDLFSEEIGQRV
jgi:hypothetical protein